MRFFLDECAFCIQKHSYFFKYIFYLKEVLCNFIVVEHEK